MNIPDMLRRAAPWACACALATPAAQAADDTPGEVVPPFSHYQAWRDAPVADWRALNQRVDEIGGWRTYLRESQPDDETGGAMGGDHAHHGHHGH